MFINPSTTYIPSPDWPPPCPVSAWSRPAPSERRCAPLSCPGWRCPACSACLGAEEAPGGPRDPRGKPRKKGRKDDLTGKMKR